MTFLFLSFTTARKKALFIRNEVNEKKNVILKKATLNSEIENKRPRKQENRITGDVGENLHVYDIERKKKSKMKYFNHIK